MLAYEAMFGIAWVIVIGFAIKTFLEYRIQRLIIDRKMVDENLSHLFTKPEPKTGSSSLKWGMVLVGIGFGFLAQQIWPDTFTEQGTAGLILLLGGIGFIAHYFISKMEEK